ncbi:MAG: NifU family protein [Candidatus Zixiibacteriota bacterium]
MDQDIKILGEPQNNETCKFIVDRAVLPGRSVSFPDAASATGSSLAEHLFAVEGVSSLRISENIITVNKSGSEEWMVVGKKIGAAIRAHIHSGRPAISEEAAARVPDDNAIKAQLKTLIAEQINPALASHGGWVSLIDVKGANVYIEMGGGCQGCGSARMTLKHGIEQMIRSAVPEVGEVLDTTDHAAGMNPYYSPA